MKPILVALLILVATPALAGCGSGCGGACCGPPVSASCGDAAADAGNSDVAQSTDSTLADTALDGTIGNQCNTTADCDPTPTNDLVCSHTTPGCSVAGTCVQRRMCSETQTYCGCNGETFQSEICFNGIPAAWVHEGACDADAGADANTGE